MSRMRLRLLGLALGACVLHCADLPRLDIGTCGNGVVEQEEDCDTFPTADPDAAIDPKSKKLACGTTGASACRYVCTTSAQCPDGWGCSVAGVCRAPKGEFPKTSEPLSAGVVSLVTGDFDADGRKDVLASGPRNVDGSARARVLYFGDGAALEHVTPLTAPIASPTVRDFDGDGIDDFVFGAGGLGAFDVMTGQADRTFIPVIFPSARLAGTDMRPVQVRAPKGVLPSGDTSVFLLAGKLTSQSGKTSGNFIISGDASKGGYARPLPFGPEAINGSPIAAQLFDADPTSTCGEVVIATNAGQLLIFSPCKPDPAGGMAWANDRQPITLTGMDPTSTVFAAYVDGDKHVDLVYRSADKKDTLVVAHGDGTGFPANKITLGEIPGGEVPLASGDLNGDGYPEFITPSGLVGSEIADGGTNPTYTAFNIQKRSRWTSARVGNFNGDAYLDFVAASADLPDIDFFSGSKSFSYTSSTLATDGPVSFLTTGDFDGDTVSDVVFVEGRAGSRTTDVSIAYGRPFGAPEQPVTIGRLADISFIDAIDTTPASLGLFLKEKTPTGDPQLAIAIMAGSGDRQPLAPLFLSDLQAKRPLVRTQGGAVERRWSPVSVHVGPFVEADRSDIVALAIGYTFTDVGQPVLPFPTGVWTAPGTKPTGSYGAATELGDLGPRIDAVDPKTLSSLLPTDTGDLDGDGLPDFVTVGRTVGDPKPGLVISHLKTSPPTVEAVALTGDVTVGPASALRLLDVDGDDKLDVVLVLSDASGGSKALVLFNDGKGGFGGAPVAVPIPPLPPDAKRTDAGPVDVALVTTGGADRSGKGSAKRQLAVVTERRLLFATLRADRSGFDVKDAELASLQSCTGLVAADVDGDGVEDLAIADNSSLRVFRQKEIHEK